MLPDASLSQAADLHDHDCAHVLRINVTMDLGGKSYLNFVSHLQPLATILDSMAVEEY